jgi:hypothetical protein
MNRFMLLPPLLLLLRLLLAGSQNVSRAASPGPAGY